MNTMPLFGVLNVFPTRVGMFREHSATNAACYSFPHTRGDVPWGDCLRSIVTWFSPHAWGCSDIPCYDTRNGKVFPTRVGMFRVLHAVMPIATAFSPHAWGCSGVLFDGPASAQVFPTRVGMFRIVWVHMAITKPFSPHAWGCSAWRPVRHRAGGVFPTRVGMFRYRCAILNDLECFPHTRGDVPPA